jgi:hypothetical protein
MNGSQHSTHTVTLPVTVTQMTSSVQTGAEGGTLRIWTELDESAEGNSLPTGIKQNGRHFCLQWTGLEGRGGTGRAPAQVTFSLQRRRNLGWDESATVQGRMGPGSGAHRRSPALTGTPRRAGSVVRDEGQQYNTIESRILHRDRISDTRQAYALPSPSI